MSNSWAKKLLIIPLMSFVVLTSCDDPAHEEAARMAKELKSHVYAVRSPFVILAKHRKQPEQQYDVFRTGGAVAFSDEKSDDAKTLGPHRTASVAIGENFGVTVRYSSNGKGDVTIHDVSVANNHYAVMDWLGDGTYDMRLDFDRKKQFVRYEGKWMETMPGDDPQASYFDRKLKASGNWVRFDRKEGRWVLRTDSGSPDR